MTLADSFRRATPLQQTVVAAGVLAVIAAVLCGVYVSVLRTRYEVLFAGLRATDAAAVTAELDKQKTPYRLADGGATILAPAPLIAKTRLSLVNSAAPLKGTVGFELFNKSDMGLTEFAQQINYQRALQGELARTIMSLDEVEDARIHLALPEHAIFRDEAKPPKASVSLRTRSGKTLSASAVRGIQRLVAAAIPDLDADHVVVLDDQGSVVSDDAGSGAAEAGSPVPIGERYEAIIRAALWESFPSRRFAVSVLAGVDAASESTSTSLVAGEAVPTARTFPLKVAITADPPTTVEEELAVRNVVRGAIHADQNQGDVIDYRIAAAPGGAGWTAPSTTASAPVRIGPATLWTGLAAFLFVLLGVAAVLLRRTRRSTPRLSVEQRFEYARRLRAVLDGPRIDEAV